MSYHGDMLAGAARQPLGHEIHTATRQYHTSLNRLITARLPLCLPPHAQDASIYTHGITAFAELYFTFEREWTSMISSPKPTDTPPHIQTLLRSLYNPSLLRTDRLKQDLSLLNNHYQPTNPSTSQSSLPSIISTRTHSHPHTLLAYPWILYLALFNGGRWIRSQLLSASSSNPNQHPFWPHPHSAARYLTFWHFDGDSDGEDLKSEFKARFEAVATQLSDKERQDIIEESLRIFGMCESIVRELDDQMAVMRANTEEQNRETSFSSALSKLPLVSGLTRQLYGVLAWMGALVPSRSMVVQQREEVEVR